MTSGAAIVVYIDADACPVKQEVYRVAERHGLKVFVVSNSPIAIPRDPLIERVVVAAGMDAADDWIAERAAKGVIVVTAGHPARGARREGRCGGNCAERQAVFRRHHRHGACDAQLNGLAALSRRDHRRTEAIFAEGPVRLSSKSRPGDRQAEARRTRRAPLNERSRRRLRRLPDICILVAVSPSGWPAPCRRLRRASP